MTVIVPASVAAYAVGSSMREGASRARRQSVATTGSRRATVAALLMKADTAAVARITSSMSRLSLAPPARWTPRASSDATPLSLRPMATTKVAAIAMTAWLPKPDNASLALTVPVTARTTGIPMAT